MRGLGVVAVVVGVLGLAARADAVTFGANLNRPVNSATTCADFLVFGGPFTCSAESVNLITGESAVPPLGDGVISRVRVKVGPVTGPMQIVVEEALRKENPGDPGHPIYACCKAINASQIFTPAPNSVTTVNTNFPVRQSPAPEESGYYVDDHLSLSVLATNVPIPASQDPNAAVALWFPAWQVGQERANAYGTSGATILMNADWDPVGGGVGGAGLAAVALSDAVATVRRNQALIDLVCNLTQACDGTLRLQRRQAARVAVAKAAKPRQATYAKARFSIGAGATKTVKAKLKSAGKQLLRKHRRAKVWLNVSLPGASVPPVQVKLKR